MTNVLSLYNLSTVVWFLISDKQSTELSVVLHWQCCWQTIVDCREHLLPDRNSVQSIWYNRMWATFACCRWSFRQPQKEHTKNWSEAKCEKQWKASTAATVYAFHALLLSLPFCSGPLVKQSAFSLCRGSSTLSYMLMYLLDDCIEARLCRLKTPLCRPSEGKYLCNGTQPRYHKTHKLCLLNNQTNALEKLMNLLKIKTVKQKLNAGGLQ